MVLRRWPMVLIALLVCTLPTQATPGTKVFLPLVSAPAPASPFGFDLRWYIGANVLPYVRDLRPRWARAGEVLWPDVEPVRGGGYRWQALAGIESNIKRLRALGIEPTLIIQRSPAWAQRVPGRLCSPPKPEAVADFARFTRALAARYAGQVNYWEVWNEPDVAPDQVVDDDGFGCWVDPALPNFGGNYYGEVVKQVAPAIRAGNAQARVIAGALLYQWPDDSVSQAFLRGMLATGAGSSIDALSFHAYGEWGAGDLLVAKTTRVRQTLATYGLADKPLFATEIAATCGTNKLAGCQPDFERWKLRQANYAARIYAEALALDLEGAFWYTLTLNNPGFQYSHLIDWSNGALAPRKSYYAFLNSARLLEGAQYSGPPLVEPSIDQMDKVQALRFRKRASVLWVLWVPKIDFPAIYNLPVPVGARAICTDHLADNPPTTYDCTDTNRDGLIPRAVNELPQYVEVFE